MKLSRHEQERVGVSIKASPTVQRGRQMTPHRRALKRRLKEVGVALSAFDTWRVRHPEHDDWTDYQVIEQIQANRKRWHRDDLESRRAEMREVANSGVSAITYRGWRRRYPEYADWPVSRVVETIKRNIQRKNGGHGQNIGAAADADQRSDEQ